jgi:hypothetical protein
MANAFRIHAMEQGRDPSRYHLLAFGGAGPVHAYGVQTAEGYEFLVLRDGKWQPLEDGGPLRSRSVSRPFYLQLRVEGRAVAPLRPDAREELKPQILLLSSGDATEFTLDLRAEQYPPFWRLQGDVLGHLKLERKESS